MSATRGSITPPSYRRAAVRLRQAVEWNQYDAAFQREGRIVPLVDANAVKLFLDPENETTQVDPFNLLGGTSGRPERRALLTFARITAEFLFLSAPVRIGLEEGRLWKEPPLLAPGHSEEVVGMLRRIEAKSRQIYEVARRSTEAEAVHAGDTTARLRIEDFAAALSAGGEAGDVSSNTLRPLVLRMADAFDGLFVPRTGMKEEEMSSALALREAVRWLRLMREGKLRPLTTHLLCDAEVLSPPEVEVRRFLDPLLKKKRTTAAGRGDEREQTERLARHDATALVQAISMNERARNASRGAGEKVRFVLISGDETLHEVYADDFWSSSERPDRANYVLRRPLQYVPVMNVNDIPNGYRAAALFEDLVGMLDSFTSFVEPRTDQAFALEHDWRRLTVGVSQGAQSDAARKQVARLISHWGEAIQTSSVLSAGLAVRDFGLRKLFDSLDRLTSRSEAVNPLVQLHESIFSEIDGIHLPLVVQELLTVAGDALQRQRTAGAVAGVRMPLLIQERFDEFTDGVPIDEYLVALAGGGRGRGSGQERKLAGRLAHEKRRYRVLFLAGTIAALANHFELAARHLARASALLRSTTEHRNVSSSARDLAEIAYLRAVVDRMRMRSYRDYRHAEERLRTIAASSAAGSFAWARATSEIAALHLMQFYNARFEIAAPPKEEAAPLHLKSLAARAGEELATLRQKLPDLRRAAAAEPPLMRALEMQVHANTLCWAVATSGFFTSGRQGVISMPGVASGSLQALESLSIASGDEDFIVGLWQLVALWLLEQPNNQSHEAARRLHTYCVDRLAAVNAISAEFRPPADAEVLRFVRNETAAAAG